MKKKIIVIIFFCMFIITSFSSIGVIAYNKAIKTQIKTEKTSKNTNEFFKILNEHVNINPMKNRIINQVIGSNNKGDTIYIPGFYEFKPCNAIDISGIGTITELNSNLTIYLHDGIANLNNSYSDIFIEWEISAFIFITNFEGEWQGSNEFPFEPLSVTGSSDYASLTEFSYLLEIDIKQDKYAREKDIPATVQRMNFLYKPLRTIEIINPHFYVYYVNTQENVTDLIREEIIEDIWTITLLKGKTWNWNQKNDLGEQAIDGIYIISGEFEVEGRIHPVLGDGTEIVEKIARNVNYPFFEIMNRLSNRFLILRNLLRLI